MTDAPKIEKSPIDDILQSNDWELLSTEEVQQVLDYYKDKRKETEKELIEQANKNQIKYINAQENLRLRLKQKYLNEESKYTEKGIKLTEANKRAINRKLAKEEEEERKKLELELAKENLKNLNNYTGKFSDKMKAIGKDFGTVLQANLQKGLTSAFKSVSKSIDSVMSTYVQYQSGVTTRLQGSGKKFTSIESAISGAIGVNPYVKLEDIMKNVASATEKGIAYNIEMRSFLESVKDDIATTFDAFDSNLLRIIRIQQSDSTAARLGLESSLTKYFNENFADSSYMSDAFDAVSGALLEASSTMSSENAVAFEYQVQKWLGSLYSVGVDSSTISSLAQAIGYLGSGDYSSLSGSSAQNLLVMAMNKAGLNYGSLLQTGLNANNTNSLLEAVVDYLQDISETQNNVVKSGYANIFGVKVSDLTAVKNLNASTIAGSYQSYAGSVAELANSLGTIGDRLTLSEMLSNYGDNLTWSMGSKIANNPALYAVYKIAKVITDAGGINLPTISALGTSIDLETNLENILMGTVVGTSALGGIAGIINGIGSTFSPSSMLTSLGLLSSTTNTAGGLLSNTSGLSTSGSTMISSSGTTDIYSGTVASSKSAAQAEMDATLATEITTKDIYNVLTTNISDKLTAIGSALGANMGDSSKSNAGTVDVGEDTQTTTIKNIEGYVQTMASDISAIKDSFQSVIVGGSISTVGGPC